MLTVSDMLLAISRVYNSNKGEFLDAQKNPQIINYLVGKILVETRGKADPKTVINIIKAIVDSDLPNTLTVDITEAVIDLKESIDQTSCNIPGCDGSHYNIT